MSSHNNKDERLEQAELTQINVGDLKIGMYVSELDRPWLETSFVFQGFELKTAADIKAVQKFCDYVYIDVSKQKNKIILENKPSLNLAGGQFSRRNAPEQKSDFSREFPNAQSAYNKVGELVKDFMEEVTLGHPVNVELAKEAVAECAESVLQAPDALMWLTQLKRKDVYTSQHCLNVCIYAIVIGRELNLPRRELELLGLCGLMHDMGKMKIPADILNKPDSLEPKELVIMKSHAIEGMKWLVANNGFPGSVVAAALGHHERLDGQGYPRKLKEKNIPPFTRIVAVADTYDAITSDRVYKKGLTHTEAVNILMQSKANSLDGEVVDRFIQSLGIFPPGNLVEMNNGEVAVVVETNPLKRLRPKIALLLNKNKQPVKPRLIDLALANQDDAGQPYAIKAIVRPDSYGIDMVKLHRLGLLGLALS